MYIFVTVLIALGAFNSQNNLLFWAFGLALAVFVVSGIISGAMLLGVQVQRIGVSDAHAGDQIRIRYQATVRGGIIPAFALTVEEALPVTPRRRRGWIGSGGAAAASGPIVESPTAFFSHVGPREIVAADSCSRALRRGVLPLRSVVVHSSFPFGLIRKSLVFDAPGEICIFPRFAEIDPDIASVVDALGDSENSGRLRGGGQSDDFHSLREYVPGDSPRVIAWKPSARRGFLLVKQSLSPAPHRVWIILRLRSGPHADPAADERAISLAATVAKRALASGMAVGLAVPLEQASIPPRADVNQARRIYSALARIGAAGSERRADLDFFPAAATHGRGHCICIHAGQVNAAYGPAGRCTHISADRPDAAGPRVIGAHPESSTSGMHSAAREGGRA